MIAIALVLIAAISIIAVAAVLYWIYYRHRINKQLHDETQHTRRLLSPLTFTVISAFVVLIAYIWLAAVFAPNNSGGVKIPQEYRYALYDYRDYSPQQMTGYRSLFSISENPGYAKTVEQKGDIKFTCFTSNDDFDHFHPSFIVYAEYTGDKDILYYGIMGNFYMPNDEHMAGSGHVGSEFSEYICVMGTSSVQSRLELTVYLYDSNLKSEDPSEYAAAYETIDILIPAVKP
jgi:hypothetical protein